MTLIKMKINKNMFFFLFQMHICLWIDAVIFELDKVSMSNFVKFEFLRMTLKIERVFEKTNKILS